MLEYCLSWEAHYLFFQFFLDQFSRKWLIEQYRQMSMNKIQGHKNCQWPKLGKLTFTSWDQLLISKYVRKIFFYWKSFQGNCLLGHSHFCLNYRCPFISPFVYFSWNKDLKSCRSSLRLKIPSFSSTNYFIKYYPDHVRLDYFATLTYILECQAILKHNLTWLCTNIKDMHKYQVL